MRHFLINYEENKKYNPLKGNKVISLSKPSGDIGSDAHAALNIFIKQFGNLKKNNIVMIQELDEKGMPIGEPITPMGDSSIVPTRR